MSRRTTNCRPAARSRSTISADDGRNRIRLSPPLRQSLVSGQIISLAPIFVGHCVTDMPGFEALEHGLYGEHTLEFVEDLTRLVESVD